MIEIVEMREPLAPFAGGSVSIDVVPAASGQTRYFQLAYRDFAPGYCTPSNVDHSIAIGVSW